MAFPTDWTGPFRILSDYTQVDGVDITDHPWLLKDADFPDYVYTHTKSDGGDLRFTTDEAGTTELPFEVVLWDTSNKKSEVWINIPTLSYTTNTAVYIWCNNSGASMPSATDSNGSQAVWGSEYSLVIHGTIPTGSSNDIKDSTSKAHHGTSFGSMGGLVDGVFGKALDFDYSNDYISVADHSDLDLGTSTIQAIIKMKHTNSTNTSLVEKGILPTESALNYTLAFDNYSGPDKRIKGTFQKDSSNSIVVLDDSGELDTSFHLYHLTINITTHIGYLYRDGNQAGTTTTAGVTSGFNSGQPLYLGVAKTYGDYFADAQIDEIRIVKGVDIAPAIIKTEYNNMFNTNFWIQEDTVFTKENSSVLPSDNTNLTTLYTYTEIGKVASDDDERVSQSGIDYQIHQFQTPAHENNTDEILITVQVQTDKDPTSAPVHLQIYNFDISEWEDLNVDSSSSIDTDFDLTGLITSNVANYYNENNVVFYRVYQ